MNTVQVGNFSIGNGQPLALWQAHVFWRAWIDVC